MMTTSLLGNLGRQWRFFAFFLIPISLCWIPIINQSDSAKAGYILLLTSIFLVVEIVPIPAIVLMSIFLMSATGLQTTAQSATHFGSDILFLFLAVLTLAISIEETNLHSRLALLSIRAIGVSPPRLILGFLLISGFLSMWMSNTAVTVMIIPIAFAVSESLSTDHADELEVEAKVSLSHQNLHADELYTEGSLGQMDKLPVVEDNDCPLEFSRPTHPQDADLSKALQLCTAYGANIGGLATLIGAYPNMLFKNSLEKLYGQDTGLTFFSFLLVCGPMALCSLLLTWVALSTLYVPGFLLCWKKKKPQATHTARRRFLDRKLAELGPMRHSEITVILIFLTVVTLWLTRDPKFVRGWGTLVKPGYATDSVVALIAAVLFFVLPANWHDFLAGKHNPILEWKGVVSKFPWELIVYSGGLTTMTALAESSGLISALGSALPDLTHIHPVFVTMIICVCISALTEVMSNSIITSIFVPILANVAEKMRVNPIYFMLTAAISSQLSFLIPIGSFPTIIVYGFGKVKLGDMIKAGAAPKFFCLVFLVCSLELLGSASFDLKSFPPWAEKRLIARTANYTINI